MKKEFGSGGRLSGRNMDQVKAMAKALQFQTHRPIGLVILVSPDDENLRSKSLNGF